MQQVPGDAAIRDTIAAVFRSQDYTRSWSDILWGAFWQFVEHVFRAVEQAARDHPFIFWVAVALVALLVVLVLARGAWLSKKAAELSARLARSRGSGEAGDDDSDGWRVAQQLAAKGEYTEAAHALYRHLLTILAATERVQLHPAKTVGDYGRELRARSSHRLSGYRNFARTYEVVVYGHGHCDEERFDRLLILANALREKNG